MVGVTVSARLRELAGRATRGPWWADDGEDDGWNVWDTDGVPAKAVAHDIFNDNDRRLIALVPELAVKHADLLDWAQAAAEVLGEYDAQCECGTCTKNAALLARLAVLFGEGEQIVGADE